MILGVITSHQPSDTLDYDVSYTEWFGGLSDSIASTNVEVTGGDGVLAVQDVNAGDDLVKLWIIGGTAGIEYKVELTITTVAGRVRQDELIFAIQEY